MYIYLASSDAYKATNVGRIGCTEDPQKQLRTFLARCPPGLTPSCDIEYVAIWETTAINRDQLLDFEDEVHDRFLRYRMMRRIPGDSEWFNFGKNNFDVVIKFMESRTWVTRQVELSEIAPISPQQQHDDITDDE